MNGISTGNDNRYVMIIRLDCVHFIYILYSQVSGSILSCAIELNITRVDLSGSNV